MSSEYEDEEIHMPELFPLINMYLDNIYNTPEDEYRAMAKNSESDILYNIVRDKEFQSIKEKIASAIALFCEIPDKELLHGIENNSIIQQGLEILNQIGTLNDPYELYTYIGDELKEVKNYTPLAEKYFKIFSDTVREVPLKEKMPFKWGMTNESIFLLMQFVVVFGSSIMDGVTFEEVYKEMGLE